MATPVYSSTNPLPLVVLISGNGSNLQAIIDAITAGLPAKICAVISNNPDAYGLQRAKQANIPTEIILRKTFLNREAFDTALQQSITRYQPQLIVLAGFMHILGRAFIEAFSQRIINIHPSLLPKYPGLATHAQVLANGDKEHGVTIHYVTAEVDAGPIIAQAKLAVLAEDTAESLQQRVHQLEHELYPKVIAKFTQHGIIDKLF